MAPQDNGQGPVIALLIQGQAEMRESLKIMQEDVTQIRLTIAEHQGQWKGARTLAAAVSAVVGFASSVITFMVATKFGGK
jgi:hypothetical protein